jgi:hypothetical protein
MKTKNKITRREFVGTTAAATAFTIVPSHVLGGSRHVAPSDKLNIAYIGCGTQGIREMASLIRNEDVQITYQLCGLVPVRDPGHGPGSPRGT